MSESANEEPAFVLHRRPYRETSLLVDLFTLSHGAVSVVARGAGRGRSTWNAELQPFQPLRVGWKGRGSLRNLVAAESSARPLQPAGHRLYCGLYLNELLQRLMTASQGAPELFSAYLEALESLVDTTQAVEPILRRFEWTLACELGYGFDWRWASDSQRPIEPGQTYGFDPQAGFLEYSNGQLGPLAGEQLLALAEGRLDEPEARRCAKRIMRHLVDHLLQGRPLHSRRLFPTGGASQ